MMGFAQVLVEGVPPRPHGGVAGRRGETPLLVRQGVVQRHKESHSLHSGGPPPPWSPLRIATEGYRQRHTMMGFAQVLVEGVPPRPHGGVAGRRGKGDGKPSTGKPTTPGSTREGGEEEMAINALLGLQNETPKLSHKQVEQQRRLTAKMYFEELRGIIPGGTDHRHDQNGVLRITVDCVRALTEDAPSPPPAAPPERGSTGAHGDDLMFEIDGLEAPKPEPEAKLRHNETEQRRRSLAREYYNQLRALLPAASDCKPPPDKNAVLAMTIEFLRARAPPQPPGPGVSALLSAAQSHAEAG
eukprot:CAMPEP_0114116398 /NCGR_PEP_ID=MMETSP0043_2-20121206/4476_1 /TAXON_ID=464988 /ORGANISM="Hemiselmis andersenii, Strain CCMP644" /LENGTH=299 /DNA_ID=CAMNT_0001208715 /DNA_START=294 /DNA_END=1190 /DNA_ORIENTATION=+